MPESADHNESAEIEPSTDGGVMYYYIDSLGEQRGPVELHALQELAARGAISPSTYVWTDGWADWRPALSVGALTFAPPVRAGELGIGVRTPWGGPPQQPPAYDPASFKKLYWWHACLLVGSMLVGTLSALVGFFLPQFMNRSPNPDAMMWIIMSIALAAGLVRIAASIPVWILIYRAWAIIQDGHAETTPGKAVGFLFIPFFNLYWEFVAIWGLAKDQRAYGQRHQVGPIVVGTGLALAAVITTTVEETLGQCIGIVGLPIILASLVLKLIVRYQIAQSAFVIASTPVGSAPSCRTCGYNLAGLPPGAPCPECGLVNALA